MCRATPAWHASIRLVEEGAGWRSEWGPNGLDSKTAASLRLWSNRGFVYGWRENTGGSGLGPWYLAKAKALSVGLSNAYFKSLGLPSSAEE